MKRRASAWASISARVSVVSRAVCEPEVPLLMTAATPMAIIEKMPIAMVTSMRVSPFFVLTIIIL